MRAADGTGPKGHLVRVVELIDGDGDGWGEFVMPGADRPVRMRRLHADPATKASVTLVDFPARWRRDEVGHYTCAEEFVVLSGGLSVSGTAYAAGDYAYVPPRAVRSDGFSEPGCLAVAYFSGVPAWVAGEPAVPADHAKVVCAPRGELRTPRPQVPGASRVHESVPVRAFDTDVDMIALATREWARVPAGQLPPPLAGPVLVRRWA